MYCFLLVVHFLFRPEDYFLHDSVNWCKKTKIVLKKTLCSWLCRTSHSKKSPGKAPRKIHKAAREKLKRDHMNQLFLDLSRALGMLVNRKLHFTGYCVRHEFMIEGLTIYADLDHPNNGKAAILRETVRLLGELLTQVDNLKKENTTLLSESNYVSSLNATLNSRILLSSS